MLLNLVAILSMVLAAGFWGDGEPIAAGICAMVPVAILAYTAWPWMRKWVP